jgi:predicted N-acetyltransferase YhbS
MLEVRTFDGELGDLHSLIQASWLQDYRDHFKQPVIDYSSVPYLEWNLNRPKSSHELRIAAYLDDQLVGFTAGIPFTLKLQDKTIQSVLGSFLTTHVNYKGRGIAKALLKEFVNRMQEMQFELLYTVTDEGHAPENIFNTLAAKMAVPYRTFYRFTYLSKPLNKQKITELSDLPSYQRIALPFITKRTTRPKNHKYTLEAETPVEAVVEMLNQSPSPQSLSVSWVEDDLSYDLNSGFSKVFFLNASSKMGLVLYYHMNLIGCTSREAVHPMTIIDCVRFKNMSFYEKHKFISNFCSQEKETGSCVVAVPTMLGFDLRPFYANLFFPSGRYYHFVGSDLKNLLDFPLDLDYLLFR